MDSLGLAMVLVIPAAIAFAIFFGWGVTILLLLFRRTRALAFSVGLSGVVSAGYCLIFSMLASYVGLGTRMAVAGLPSQAVGSSVLALALGFGIGASCAAVIGVPIYLLFAVVSNRRQREH